MKDWAYSFFLFCLLSSLFYWIIDFGLIDFNRLFLVFKSYFYLILSFFLFVIFFVLIGFIWF
ncbi:hypothetical protein MWE_1330 [Helicobacter pylori XZ274]|nr:hypothetical protein MWE_1330 [Helicobacter pylori XZ274]